MKRWFLLGTKVLLVLMMAIGFSKPKLAFAKPEESTVGKIWTTSEGCDSIQNKNHYQVGETIYVHYDGFIPGDYVLTIDQVSGSLKPRVEGPRTVTLAASGCFTAHVVQASEAGNEFTLDLGKGHNDNYGVNEYAAPTPTDPTLTETEPTSTPTEVTPTATDPTPTETEATPTETEVTPTATELTPTATESTPTATESTPTATEATPTATESTPTATEPTPTATEATPTATEPTPIVTEVTPVVTDAVPEPTEATPVPTDSAPETTTVPTDSAPETTPTPVATAPATTNTTVVQIPVTGPAAKGKSTGLAIPVTGSRIIVAGLAHTCMTADGGRVVCWGLNTSGQVGNDTFTNQLQAVYVKNLDGVINLTAGSLHTCALTSDNEVWCWGENGSGQLGDGTTTNSSIPVKVTGLPDTVVNFTAGEDFTCAQLKNKEIWCWGDNAQGQLNDGTTTNRLSPVKSTLSSSPIVISGGLSGFLGSSFSNVDFWNSQQATAVNNFNNPLSISANRWQNAGCAVAGDGSVNCWGSDLQSSIVESLLPALEVETGLNHDCVINEDLTVSCWGSNLRGQLGNGTNVDSNSITLVNNLTKVNDLAVGANHTCVLQGEMMAALCWGENTFGQLGVKTTTDSNVPLWVYPPVEN